MILSRAHQPSGLEGTGVAGAAASEARRAVALACRTNGATGSGMPLTESGMGRPGGGWKGQTGKQ